MWKKGDQLEMHLGRKYIFLKLLKADKIFYESIHLSPHGYHLIQTELKAFSEKSARNAHADRGFTGTVLDCGIGTVV